MREQRNKALCKRVHEINIPDSRKFSRVKDNKKTVTVKKNGRGDNRVSSSSTSGMLSTGASCSSPTKSDYSEESGTDHSGSSNAGTNSSGQVGTRASVPSSTKKNSSGMKFYAGLRLEAKDLGNDVWYAVKVVEVDQEEDEILIHFEKWSQRYDEWIPMDSSRLRPIQEPPGGFTKKSVKVFKAGDNVMATWSDSRKYPAKVKTVLGNDRYEVLFYDGFTKNIKGGRMSRLSEEEATKIEQLKPGIGPSNDVSVTSSSSSFAPKKISGGVLETTLGTKEERRERKRKLNVAELFHFKKRRRVDNPPVRGTESLFSNSRGSKKQSVFEETSASVSENRASKTGVSKGNVSDITEENFSNRSESNAEFGGTKKREPTLKSSDCPEKNRKRSKYDSSQDVDKKDGKPLLFTKNVRRRLEGGRKPYSISASARKDVAVGSQKGEEGSGALESVLKPQEEWVPKGEPAYVVDGTGGPRKSIVVDDPRVPTGWSRHFIQRMSGHSAGKWDVFFVCPQGRKFRTRHELRSYYEDRNEPFPTEQFDFSLGRRKNKSHTTDRDVAATPEGLGSNKTSQQAGSSHPHVFGPTLKGISTETPVRRVKTLLPRVRASDSTSIMPSSDIDTFDEQSNLSDNSVVFGDLKIEKENDAFKCPKEGCCKNFRKESLLQMHMKHYHPEYNRFVASTPNVADLAYARTIGEPVEDLHPRTPRPSLLQKISRFEAMRRLHAVSPSGVASSSPSSSYSSPHHGSMLHASLNVTSDSPGLLSPSGHSNTADYHSTPGSYRTLDSSNMSIAGDLDSVRHNSSLSIGGVNTDVPKRTIRTLMPVTRTSVSETCTTDEADDAGEMVDVTDVTPGPKLSLSTTEQDLEHADMQGLKQSHSPPLTLPYVSMGQTKSSRMVRRKHMTDFHMEPVMKKRKPTESEDSSQTSLVTGSTNRQTRVETLRREELVNCTCGYPEEDGLMIQCDLCMCWQHGLCNSIEHEDEVPEKYVCYICLHPSRERPSKHFLHDQDWLKEGRLPTLSFRSKNESDISQRTTILKRSHELIGTLLQLQQVIRSLRVKVNIAEMPDHPKLYLWNQSWEKDGSNHNPRNVSSQIHSVMRSQLPEEVQDFKEKKDIKESNLNVNEVEKSSSPSSHVPPPVSNPIGHDVEGDLIECHSTDIEGEASDICPGRESTHLMVDDCDTKDTFFSQDSLSSVKGDNVPPDHQTQTDAKDTASHVSDRILLDSTSNVGEESEVVPGSDATEQGNIQNTAEENEEVELKEPENKDQPDIHTGESSVIAPDPSLNSDTIDKDALTSRDIGSMDENDLQLPFCQKDLLHLASSMADKLDSLDVPEENPPTPITSQRVPQPEAPIVPRECRKTLLQHISTYHQQLEARLTSLETQIAGLESMDPYLAHDESTDQQTRETVQMLLRDLTLLRNVASLN